MQIIKFKIEDMKDITTMADFMRKIGILFKEPGSEKETLLITDVRQYSMNKKSAAILRDYLLSNQKLQKDRRLKNLSKQGYEMAVAMEWLNYSPVEKDEIPEDEIWLDI